MQRVAAPHRCALLARRLCARAASAAPAVQQPEERVVIVDLANTVVGEASRRDMRARNLPYRASFVLLFRSSGELFVQRRVAWKETYPGHFDCAPGGVVQSGESYEQNAAREMEEEMGVRGTPLTPLFDFWFEDAATRVWGRLFSCVYDGPVTLQASEVESGAWLSLDAAQDAAPCCPDSRAALEEYRRPLDAGQLTLPYSGGAAA